MSDKPTTDELAHMLTAALLSGDKLAENAAMKLIVIIGEAKHG